MTLKIKEIAHIDTPIKLLAIIVVVTEIVLTAIIYTLSLGSVEKLIIIIGMIAALLITAFAAFKSSTQTVVTSGNLDEVIPAMRYDVFISAPMASVNQDEYEKMRRWVLDVHDTFERYKYTAFYAGKHLMDRDEFEDPAEAVKADLKAVDESSNFVMIYPQRVATSGLVELGYALARNKRIWILIKNEDDLPYLMKKLDAAYDNVAITKYDNDDHFMNLLEASHQQILRPS